MLADVRNVHKHSKLISLAQLLAPIALLGFLSLGPVASRALAESSRAQPTTTPGLLHAEQSDSRQPLQGQARLAAEGEKPSKDRSASSSNETQLLALGRTEGRFEVDQDGAATYSVPVEVPPGRQGVEPDLEIAYNSSGGNGMLGVGWSLTGISSIARCRATEAQDGRIGAINYDDEDRFCLDGMRLIAVSGEDGADNTEYRTEKESWLRIVSHDRSGNGPSYFTAITSQGYEIEFGNTDRSKVEAQGRDEVRLWGLNKLTDRNGNFLTIDYFEDNGTGESRPTAIEYTSHDNGLTPSKKVELLYEDREDRLIGYTAGSVEKTTKRLHKVLTSVDGAMVKEYRLGYEYGQATRRSRLASIEECASTGDGEIICLSPTTFEWSEGTNTFGTDTNWGNRNSDNNIAKSGVSNWVVDLNGDGFKDYMYLKDGHDDEIWVILNDGEGGFEADTYWTTRKEDVGWDGNGNWVADVNADGYPDYVYHKQTHDDYRVLLNDGGTGFGEDTLWGRKRYGDNVAWSGLGSWMADMDGDGFTDYIYHRDGTHEYYAMLSDGTSFSEPIKWGNKSHDVGFNENGNWILDMNNDGLPDCVYHKKTGDEYWVMLNDGERFASAQKWGDKKYGTEVAWDKGHWLTDINDDGLPDYVYHEKSSHNYWRLLNTGSSFKEAEVWGSKSHDIHHNEKGHWLTDIDGDRLPDLVYNRRGNGDNDMQVLLNQGTESGLGTEQRWFIRSHELAYDGKVQWFEDMDGDGQADYLYNRHNTKENRVLRKNAPFPDQVLALTDGLGQQTEVTYAPLTDSEVYTKGTDAEFPLSDDISSSYVVSQHRVKESPGADHSFRYDHQYIAAQSDHDRGTLGFKQVITSDHQAGTRTTRFHNMAFPLTGTVREERIETLDGGQIIGINTWEHESTSPSYSQIYNATLLFEERDHYDENGVSAYQVRTEYSYDADGQNITLTSHLGEVGNSADDVYECRRYAEGSDGSWWHSFSVTDQKMVTASSACSNWDTWDPAQDLSWGRNSFDGAMNLVSEESWDDGKEKFIESLVSYDPYGNPVSMTDPLGQSTTITYDTASHTFPETQTLGGLQAVRKFDPAFGEIIEMVDANGNTLKRVFDAFGRLLETWGPNPQGEQVLLATEQYLQAESGELYRESRRRLSWDADETSGWPWERSYFDGLERRYRSEAIGADGETIRSDTLFDDRGRISKTSFPYVEGDPPQYQTQVYDHLGRPYQLVDGNDAVLQEATFQAGIREATVKLPAYGNTDSAAGISDDPKSYVTTTVTFDVRGRVVRKEADAGDEKAVTTFGYDRLGRHVRTTDALGVEASVTYNSLGQIIAQDNPETGLWTISYDDAGRIGSVVDAKNQKVSFEHDALGRITSKKTFLSASDSTPQRTIIFEFDDPAHQNSLGQLSTVSEAGQYTMGYDYDAYGHVATFAMELDTDLDGNLDRYTFENTHNALGQLDSLVYPDGSEQEYSYHGNSAIQSVRLRELTGSSTAASAGSSASTFDEWTTFATYGQYNPFGEFEHIDYGNGLKNERQFDSIGRLTGNQVIDGSERYLDHRYVWNKANKILTKTDARENPLVDLGEEAVPAPESFSYDAQGHLAAASGPYDAFTYTYDFEGNMLGDGQNTYTFGDGTKKHQLTAGVVEGAGLTFEYDANGNLIRKTGTSSARNTTDDPQDSTGPRHSPDGSTPDGSRSGSALWEYEYDVENRLTAVKKDGEVVNSFAYDFRGRRLRKTDVHADGDVISYYISRVYDITAYESGDGPQQLHTKYIQGLQGHVASITRLQPSTTANSSASSELRDLDPGDNGPGIPDEETIQYYHQDHINGTALVTDEGGTPFATVAYMPFGRIDQDRSFGEDNFRSKFATGQEWDDNSELYHFNIRYYDPTLGRFLTPDPAGEFASPYTYATNDPLSYVDPEGTSVIAAVSAFAARNAVRIGAILGAYSTAAAINETGRISQWDFSLGSGTWLGLIGGGVIGGLTKSGKQKNAAKDRGKWEKLGISVGISAAEGAALAVLDNVILRFQEGDEYEREPGAVFSAAIGGAVSGLAFELVSMAGDEILSGIKKYRGKEKSVDLSPGKKDFSSPLSGTEGRYTKLGENQPLRSQATAPSGSSLEPPPSLVKTGHQWAEDGAESFSYFAPRTEGQLSPASNLTDDLVSKATCSSPKDGDPGLIDFEATADSSPDVDRFADDDHDHIHSWWSEDL